MWVEGRQAPIFEGADLSRAMAEVRSAEPSLHGPQLLAPEDRAAYELVVEDAAK